jgi:SagB-type dehydrogenase family enzyme
VRPRRLEPDVARLFHLHSSHSRLRLAEGQLDEDRRPLSRRTYPGARRFDLPGREQDREVSLGEVLARRRSVRDFELRPLELEVAGRVLSSSYRCRPGSSGPERPTPSAGALYPIELYLVTRSISGLPDGLYHYDALSHQLELRREGPLYDTLADLCLGQPMVSRANLTVVLTANCQRTMWKYGQRGYRYVWLDAGHLAQNLCLTATAEALGAVTVGAFFDAELNILLDLPAGEEDAVYIVCIGQPAEV